MPLHDFKCRKCEKDFPDVVLSIKVNCDPANFPQCCGEPTEKLVGNPGRAILKGRGFHCNEYGAPTHG